LFVLCAGLALCGCQAIKQALSDRLSHWQMLGDEALDDPIKAAGGDAVVFVPGPDGRPLSRQQLASAGPEALITYYAPVFVQQKVDTRSQKYPYPPEFDLIGTARLRRQSDGKLQSYVAGEPTVYAICKKLPIDGRDHVQLTYTAWYPAHPRMKALDVEEADIDSCVVRLTLDAENAPLLYETIAACGCFHKVFAQKWVEAESARFYGPPEAKKKYTIERSVRGIGWEVAGLVDEPREQPRRPVVFLKAGDHKVIGLGSMARLRMPAAGYQRAYRMASYADLHSVQVDGSGEQAGFFDMDNGGKVRGGERKKEKFLLTLIGVDDAGRPRADGAIKMHFDESEWGDPAIYNKHLRLPPGLIGVPRQ
jgi:hypothetical protein